MAALMDRIKGAYVGAIQGWNGSRAVETGMTREQLYLFYWDLYTGRMFDRYWQSTGLKNERVYRNIRLLYTPVPAIVDFYGSVVYQGQLPTDGKRLPDGSRGAIPIDPQTGDDETNELLLQGIAELWNRWKWQRSMRQRPRYAAVLGDCLTVLADDPEHHAVWPQIIWPGFVTELLLDRPGDVKAYTLEYMVTRKEGGKDVTFRYRNEVTKDEYRYFRDDKPWADHSDGGHGDAEQENPYGFVPAVWDRHKTVWGDRGLSAVAGVKQTLTEYNSFFAHAMDYQRRPFSARVLLKGSNAPVKQQRDVVAPQQVTDPDAWAQSFEVRHVAADSEYGILEVDLGQTIEMLKELKQNILETNPEASFYHELRTMSQLTGPGAERALGDAVTRANDARSEQDPQTIKIKQMALAMCGYRINRADWGQPTKRDEIFRNFNLDSYKSGQLDMTILGRPVIPQTEQERIALVQSKESLRLSQSLVELGYEEKDANRIIRDRIDLQQEKVLLYSDLARLPTVLQKKTGILTGAELAELETAQEEDTVRAQRALDRGAIDPAFDDEVIA